MTVDPQVLLNNFLNGSGNILSDNPGRKSLLVNFNQQYNWLMNVSLDFLKNKIIKDIFYYEKYEGFNSYSHIDEIVEIPFLGLLIETETGERIVITESDYSNGLDLGGIKVIQRELPFNPADRLSQIHKRQWSKYLGKKIVSLKFIDIKSEFNDNEFFIVPIGIKLVFENSEVLYIFNIYTEGYNANEGVYEFVIGDSALTLFFTEESFRKYKIS